MIGGSRYLICSATVENIGTSKLSLVHEGTCLIVAPNAVRGQGEFLRLAWDQENGAVLNIFANHDWVQSGETIRDEVAIVIPAEGYVSTGFA